MLSTEDISLFKFIERLCSIAVIHTFALLQTTPKLWDLEGELGYPEVHVDFIM